MAGIDFINSLGAGAGIDTKALVSSLVEAERAGKKSLIDKKIETNNAQISGLGTAVSKVTELRLVAIALNDATDFNNFTVSNTQSTALTVSQAVGDSRIAHHHRDQSGQSTKFEQFGRKWVVCFTSGSQTINGEIPSTWCLPSVRLTKPLKP